MPYNTTWKDGKPVEKSQKDNMQTLDPLKRIVNQVSDDNLWCFAYDMPHFPYQFIVAKKLQEEEEECEGYTDDHTINFLSFEEYNSLRKKGMVM